MNASGRKVGKGEAFANHSDSTSRTIFTDRAERL
jgi:hypothetical protein